MRFYTKRQRDLEKWLDRLADALKRLEGKAVEVLQEVLQVLQEVLLVLF